MLITSEAFSSSITEQGNVKRKLFHLRIVYNLKKKKTKEKYSQINVQTETKFFRSFS